MRSVTRSLPLLLSLALVAPPILLSMPTSAWAQGKKTIKEQLSADARKQWDAAVILIQRKDYAAAASAFRGVYETSKNPRVLYNVAVAEKEQGRYAAAYEALLLMDAQSKDLPADEAADVKSTLVAVRKFVTEVTFEVTEPNIEIFISDGAGKAEDKLDATKLPGPFWVETKTKRIRVTKPGFAELVEVIEFKGQTQKVPLRLQSLVRSSRVNVNVIGPPVATIKIDGREVGQSPWHGDVPVAAEQHTISAEAPGWATGTQPALVKEGEALNISIQLDREQAQGKLLVLAHPEGATIEIDGKIVGASRWEGPVDARVHQVVVKKSGFYSWSYDVEVPRGGERTVTASLNEDRNTSFVPWLIGSIVIGSALIGAIIFLATPPDQEPQKGTLNPFVFGTSSFHPGASGFRF